MSISISFMKLYRSRRFRIATLCLFSLLIVLGWVGYDFYQKSLADQICWYKLRRLNDDELYQAAMQDFVEVMRTIREKNIEEYMEGCKRRKDNCRVWMLPEALDKQGFQDRLSLHWGQDMFEVLEGLKAQEITYDSDRIKAGSKQGQNGFALLENIRRPNIQFYPMNCCRIYSFQEIARLHAVYKDQILLPDGSYSNIGILDMSQDVPDSRYIRIAKFSTGMQGTGFSDGNGLQHIYGFTQTTGGEPGKLLEELEFGFYKLNGCGKFIR